MTGSPIWYADGIRIQGASNVTVRNTTIVRPPGSELASAGPIHNPPYAGIEVASSSNGNSLVHVDGCTVRGFDVGIGVNLMHNQLRVQNNTIAQNTSADVRTMWAGTSPAVYPIVDLGGGTLGSVGNNDFGNGPEYAVDLGGPNRRRRHCIAHPRPIRRPAARPRVVLKLRRGPPRLFPIPRQAQRRRGRRQKEAPFQDGRATQLER